MKKLIIPIEIKKRELPGALYIAKTFLEKKWTVYLGQKQQIFPFINQFSRSVWFLKSIVPGENALLEKLKKKNHFITTLDIEGLVPSNGKYGIHQRYSKKGLILTDLIFFWGKMHYENLKRVFPEYKKKFYITGSPIVDYWNTFKKKNNENNRIKKILFISSFPLAQQMGNQKHYYSLSKHILGRNSSKEYIKKLKLEYELQNKALIDNKNILINLFRNKNYKICIRPHPSENLKYWTDFIAEYSKSNNVYLDSKTDLNNQILRSDFIIHFNSTVSVQSYFFNKRIFMLYNPSYKKFDSVISNIPKLLSMQFKNYEDLIFNIQKKNIKKKDYFFKKLIFQEDNYSSSKKIFDIINSNFNISLGKDIDPFNLLGLFMLIKFKFKEKIALILAIIAAIFKIKTRFNIQLLPKKKIGNYKWQYLSTNEIVNILLKIGFNRDRVKKIKFNRHFSGMYKLQLLT